MCMYMCMFPCFFIVFVFSLLCVFVCVLFISMDLRGLIQIKKEKKERIWYFLDIKSKSRTNVRNSCDSKSALEVFVCRSSGQQHSMTINNVRAFLTDHPQRYFKLSEAVFSGTKLWISPHCTINKLCVRPPQYAPASVTLTFDPLTLKVVSESHVTWSTYVPILVFLGLSVLDLGPMYATDRRQTDVRQHHRLMPPPRGRRHNNDEQQSIAVTPEQDVSRYISEADKRGHQLPNSRSVNATRALVLRQCSNQRANNDISSVSRHTQALLAQLRSGHCRRFAAIPQHHWLHCEPSLS